MARAADNGQRSRPNVLLILADDLGYSDLGFMGGEIPTPHIDRLAAGGVRFTQCYNSARCCPSRASLMTGLYPHQAGIGSFATRQPNRRKGPGYLGHLNDRCVTLAEVLGAAGYQTYMAGKWHMETPGPIARGFDEFYGFVHGYEQDQWSPGRYVRLPEGREPEREYEPGEFYATDAFTDYTLEFLRTARERPDQPWLMYLAHSAPHFPVQAPKETVDRFVDTYRRGWDALRQERFARMQQSGLADESWILSDRSLVPVDRPDIANGYPGEPNPAWDSLPKKRQEDLARRMAIFAAMVHHIDQGVGRITEELAAQGELDNTLILFLSDNGACYEWGPFGFDGPSRSGQTILHTGESLASMGGPGTYHAYGSGWANLCNTPFRLYKHFAHEGGVCTPLVAHWPQGIEQADRWVRQPVHLIDIMPTLCDVAGAEYPDAFQGKTIQPPEGQSLRPLLSKADAALPARSLSIEHNEARAIRRGKWKAVQAKRMPFEATWELYDLSRDRSEIEDLSGEKPQLTERLARQWRQWAARVKVHPFFDTAGEDAAPGGGSPQIARQPITVEAELTVPKEPSSGVLLAQGGNRHGYALHVDRGQLVFSVRVNQQVSSIAAPVPVGKKIEVAARLLQDASMELAVGGETVAEGRSPGGLIPVQPVDGLSLGFDDRSAVGEYEAPFRFAGEIHQVDVTTP